MKTLAISANIRKSVGKSDSKALRNQGMVPCVLYGGEKQVCFYAETNAFRNERFLWRFNLSVLKDNLKKISHANFCKGVSDLDMMFVKGENSDYIYSKDLNRIRNHFSNSKFYEIRNAGHWVHAENPNDLYDEIINFL